MKNLILTQIVFSLTLIFSGCVNQPYGHQSVYSPPSINTIVNHKLYLIAEKSAHPSFGTGEVTADKAAQYANNGEFKHEVRQFQKPYDNQQAEQISLMV
ncbi:hypothetical protein [Acinetobacter pittii]|uniref:hypothetical protein n=1 Tax=Acinetobacter pittii TaxID=48296 RepID=UPI001E4C109D|nr:hypothetical protein [Acinetobacter pittii]